jgi:hypothetical protein
MKKPDKASLAVRILERLAGRRLEYVDVGYRTISGEMSMGQLRRALNAYRLAGWNQAHKRYIARQRRVVNCARS